MIDPDRRSSVLVGGYWLEGFGRSDYYTDWIFADLKDGYSCNASTNDLGVNRAARRSRPRSRALAATGVVAAGGAGALLAALAGSASAVTTITVDSAADGAGVAGNCTDGIVGNCTLRDASLAAVDGDTVTFDAGVSSITLTGGTVVFQAVSLTGSGSANLAITTTAAPNFYNIFEFSGTGDVVISGMSLTKNRIETQNVGNAKLLDVSISGSSGAYGGALYAGNDGNLEIVDSNFSQNYSTDNEWRGLCVQHGFGND